MKTHIVCAMGLIFALLSGCSSDEIDSGEASMATGSRTGMAGGVAQPALVFADTPMKQSGDPIGEPNDMDLLEVCDGSDNDADGRVDENGCVCDGDFSCFEGPPEGRGVGECRDGQRQCGPGGEIFGACTGSVSPSDERCDQLDNDCDGVIDENCCTEPPCGPDSGPSSGGSPGPGPGPGPGPDSVQEEFIVGEHTSTAPVDFLLVIDNSGSMRDTIRQVEDNLGTFSERLANAGIDFKFALLSKRGTSSRSTDVCVEPPMAGPNCGDTDRFVHLNQKIGSHDAFSKVIRTLDNGNGKLSSFLRGNSLLQLIVVTDDESNMDWGHFKGEMTQRGFNSFTLHGVVGLRDRGCVADVGHEYIDGANQTNGSLLHICDHDWGRVLDVLVESTISQIERTFVLRGAARPNSIAVYREDQGQRQPINQWSYDEGTGTITVADEVDLPAGTTIVITYDVQ